MNKTNLCSTTSATRKVEELEQLLAAGWKFAGSGKKPTVRVQFTLPIATIQKFNAFARIIQREHVCGIEVARGAVLGAGLIVAEKEGLL